jgi:hypothetical protein
MYVIVNDVHRIDVNEMFILQEHQYNLKGSDDGVWHSKLLDFLTLFIVQNSK